MPRGPRTGCSPSWNAAAWRSWRWTRRRCRASFPGSTRSPIRGFSTSVSTAATPVAGARATCKNSSTTTTATRSCANGRTVSFRAWPPGPPRGWSSSTTMFAGRRRGMRRSSSGCSGRRRNKPNLCVALRFALAAAYGGYTSLGEGSRALILGLLRRRRVWAFELLWERLPASISRQDAAPTNNRTEHGASSIPYPASRS